jgi:beta-lactamase superfamily II metal-dependent hydrolase
MILEIFDVEHGACALITTSNGRRTMIDCGHNATTGWRPGTALARAGIRHLDQLCITNYDEDHVSGYPNLIENVTIDVLVRNGSVLPGTIRHLKSKDGMGNGIEALIRSIEGTFTGSAPAVEDYGDTSFTFHRNSYGAPFGFIDENNLSLVVFVSCGGHKIIFPGDMEKAGWRRLLLDPGFRQELSGVTLFVASHHGRENGYCEEVMRLCPEVRAVVVSDQKNTFQSQETNALYRRHATGVNFPDGSVRHVFTTRRDSSMRFHVPVSGAATVYLNVAAGVTAAA